MLSLSVQAPAMFLVNGTFNLLLDHKDFQLYEYARRVLHLELICWVPHKLPEIYTEIAYICIGKVA